jgi:hypothetical protein
LYRRLCELEKNTATVEDQDFIARHGLDKRLLTLEEKTAQNDVYTNERPDVMVESIPAQSMVTIPVELLRRLVVMAEEAQLLTECGNNSNTSRDALMHTMGQAYVNSWYVWQGLATLVKDIEEE